MRTYLYEPYATGHDCHLHACNTQVVVQLNRLSLITRVRKCHFVVEIATPLVCRLAAMYVRLASTTEFADAAGDTQCANIRGIVFACSLRFIRSRSLPSRQQCASRDDMLKVLPRTVDVAAPNGRSTSSTSTSTYSNSANDVLKTASCFGSTRIGNPRTDASPMYGSDVSTDPEADRVTQTVVDEGVVSTMAIGAGGARSPSSKSPSDGRRRRSWLQKVGPEGSIGIGLAGLGLDNLFH